MPKTFKHLYPKIYAFDNLYQAFRQARKGGKRKKESVAAFELDLEANLWRLHEELSSQTYRPDPYHNFYIQERKRRLISAAPFRDRVVHHALCNVVQPVFERRFIHDSYACRVGKGTHRALDRAQEFARRRQYVLQCDIEQFFPSIDHQVLRSFLARHIADERVLELDPTQREAAAGVAEIEQAKRRRDMKYGLQKIGELEEKGRYEPALDMARTLASRYPEEREWGADLQRLERKTSLADSYQRALGALEDGDREKARTLLARVMALEPGYEEAARYLHQAVEGVDVAEVQRQLDRERKALQEARTAAAREAKARQQREREVEQLRAELKAEKGIRREAESADKEQDVGEKRPGRLSPWNPLDHLRLLWWVLVAPRQLKAYREAFGSKDEQRVGKWLVSTLSWLPLAILVLALGLEALPQPAEGVSSSRYLVISLILPLAWMLTGRLGDRDSGVAGGVVVVVAGIVEDSVETGQPSWLARGCFGALVLAHAFLIWFSFLGGWRAFQ